MAVENDKLPELNILGDETKDEKVEVEALPALDLPELDIPELKVADSDLPNIDLSDVPKDETKGFFASLWGNVKTGALNTVAGIIEKSKTLAQAPAVSHGIYGFGGPKIKDEDTGELRDRTPEENKAIEVETEKFAFEIKNKAEAIQSELEAFDQGIWDNIKSLQFDDAGKQLAYAFANTAPTMVAIATNPYAGISSLGIGAAGSKELELRQEVEEGAEYSEAKIQASSWAYGGAEVVGDILMRGMLNQSGKLIKGLRKTGGDEAAKAGTKEFVKTLSKGFVYEGGGEGITQVLQNSVDKFSLEKDVSLSDNLADAIITGGFISANTMASSYLFGRALNKLTPQNEQETVKVNNQKIQSLTKTLNDPTVSESQKSVIENAKNSLTQENEQILSDAKNRMDTMSPENKQTIIDNTNEISKIDEVLQDPSIDGDARTALNDAKSRLQENINEILIPEENGVQQQKKDSDTEVKAESETKVETETKVEPESKVEPETETKTKEVEGVDRPSDQIVIPAETVSKASQAFEASRENLSDAEAAQESFKTVERSEWYQALPKDQQTEAKAKFLNDIAERFPPKPVKRKKSKVQEVFDRFVGPRKGKSKKVTVDEYGSLKTQIRLESKAAKEGAKSAKADITQAQDLLLDYVKDQLYNTEGKDIGKSDLTRLLSGIKSAVNYRQLGKQIDKVDSVISNVRGKELKRKKSDLAKFVGKKRTTQVSGKIKARAGDAFSIPYFEKASGVIKEIQGIIAKAKADATAKYSTEGLTGKKLSDASTSRKLATERISKQEIEKAMDNAYQQTLDKLINGPEHTVNKHSAELQAIEDFRNFDALNLEKIDEFSSMVQDIDKAGKVRLQEEIAAEATRLRQLVEDVDSSIEVKDKKEVSRRDEENKKVLTRVWEGIKSSPKDLFNFLTRPTNHVKTLLELMNTEAVEVGKSTVIQKIYKPISRAESKEIGGLAESNARIKEIATEVLGLESEQSFTDFDNRMNEPIDINTDIDGVEGVDQVTKGEAMTIYAWSRTPELANELRTKNGISEAEINRIKNELGTDIVQFVDEVGNWLSNEYADKVNDVYRQIFRIDFSGRQDYHPVSRVAGPKVEVTTDSDPFTKLHATMASALKERVSTERKLQTKTDVDGKDVSFIGLVHNHIQEMEHFIAWANVAKDVSAVLSSKNFKTRANERLGRGGYDLVSKLLRHSINKDVYKSEYGLGSKLVSAYGIGVLGAKIKQLPVQLTSMVTGMVEYENSKGRKVFGYNTYSWAKDAAALMVNPAKAGKVFSEILENNPKIRARVDRGSNLDPDFIKRESKRAAKLGTQKTFYEKVQRFVMSPTLAGDVGL